MNHPFQAGQQLGEELRQEGWLEATYLNTSQQHREDAACFARNRFPDESAEDQATVAAGIMHEWAQHRNWR